MTKSTQEIGELGLLEFRRLTELGLAPEVLGGEARSVWSVSLLNEVGNQVRHYDFN
jgi:hypothetical protein